MGAGCVQICQSLLKSNENIKKKCDRVKHSFIEYGKLQHGVSAAETELNTFIYKRKKVMMSNKTKVEAQNIPGMTECHNKTTQVPVNYQPRNNALRDDIDNSEISNIDPFSNKTMEYKYKLQLQLEQCNSSNTNVQKLRDNSIHFHTKCLASSGWNNSIYRTISIVCLLLFSLCSNVSGNSASSYPFPDSKQESFTKELSDFHISWPSQVDHSKEFLTHNIHPFHSAPHRHKRDATQNNLTQQNNHNSRPYSKLDDVINYRIQLQRDKDHVFVSVRKTGNILISPSAVVERKTSGFKNISDSKFTFLEHHKGCQLSGHVIGSVGSKVAVSACKGLRGLVHLDGEDYLIEPVKGYTIQDDKPVPHLVYKRSALPDHKDIHRAQRSDLKGKETGCGVNEKYEKIIANRERWEQRRRKREYKEVNGSSTSVSRSSSSTAHSRRKRSISTEKHVETLVVVDTDMIKYYENEDIETYVLTVMNMVANLFHDASIGNAINIVIVRMVLLQDPDENLTIMHHADKTLRNFCKWQKRINFRDDDHPNHHDVAVLLTRKNICSRMNKPCSTLGLAQVAGLCQPHKTCSINEDTGLSLAWTVAHEMGHNFGMKHDTPSVGCVSTSAIQYVMAPHLTWDKTPYKWSNCSRDAITTFLDRNWGYCLDDTPGYHDFKYPLLPAGTMYDSDHQCALLYGDGAQRCNGIEELENICTTLWCKVNNKCSTKLQAAAVGTICGADKWCFNGDCVDIGDRPQAINGQWGEWSHWTGCTRTCGAGVMVSQRHCNHPPPSNGGKYCTGERKRFRICNTEKCPENDVSFRRVQCREFNKIPYLGATYDWEDVYTPESPCQLHCKPKNKYFSVMLKDIVTDGTPCVIGSRHMCISGRCRHVGCDWVIDSDAKEDRCGVCFGDGSTCKTIKQQFNETEKLGYVEATVIPSGARNIRVEEVAEASNFLALKNEKGEYYLNGHWFIQWSGDYEVAGTVVHYKRLGNRESFKVPGPTKEPLHIMLLMQTHNPGVEFEYTVPKENVTDNRTPEFSWEVTGWSHCTVSCGGGTQRDAVVCKEQEMGVVDDIHCNASSKPDDKLRACNSHLCPARWWTGPWQHCSVTCGKEGIHRRTVICVRSLGSDEQIALEDTACANLEKPSEMDKCHRVEKCPGLGTWETTDWSTCTRECDGGVQYRKVVCVGGEVCDAEKPNSEQPCNEVPCKKAAKQIMMSFQEERANSSLLEDNKTSTSKYNIGLSKEGKEIEHSKTLSNNQAGDGINDSITRNDDSYVTETDENTELRNKNHYNKLQQREDTVNENMNEPSPNEKNHFGNTDHKNHQYRHENDIKYNSNSQHEDSSHSREHQSVRHHKHRHHHKNSKTSQQTGTRTTSEPVTNVFKWRTERWSKCSVACGTGVQTRHVICIDTRTNQRVDRVYCRHRNSRPSAIKECYGSCLEWETGQWEQCSVTCGQGVQKRQVFCKKPGKCDKSKKPPKTRECSNMKPCLSWVFGGWSQCSVSCGEGIQLRLVQCVNLTSQQLAEGCEHSSKPNAKQQCNTSKCPEDKKAALTVSCESNEMSFRVCRMLKKVGLCQKEYVKSKCCRTCQDHRRRLPPKSKTE